MHSIVSKIVDAFEQRGSGKYGEECVTQLQHALQSGQFAIRAQADTTLITAALLHDIGHIIGDDDMPVHCDENLDDHHESKGYEFLIEHFGRPVAEPVRLHVVAKRYLCTTNPAYENQLSPTSLKSFHDQGGTMSTEEIQQFENEDFYQDALRLRHWDDAAKDPEAKTPSITDFIPYLQASLIENSCE